ncbi:putative RxLR effector, partial [Phytophthora palmivora]
MGLRYALLLTVVALVARVDSSSVATESTMMNLNFHLNRADMDGLQDTRDARLLRADKSTHNDGEERASNWFTNFIKQWKPQKAQKVAPQAAPVVTKVMTQDGKNLQTLLHTLVTSQKSTDDVFQVAKLGGQMKPAEMFQPDRLPMYISFSERTFRQRGHDRWGIE